MHSYLQQLATIATHNKYFKWYCDIVSRAHQTSQYGERHHILPKSFGLGGEKDKDNIVKLSAREHFICHRLLCKMVTGVFKQKMCAALWRMNNSKCIKTSRTYEHARVEFSRSQMGHVTSKETRDKIGAAHRGKAKTYSPWNKGKTGYRIHTETSKEQILIAIKNRTPETLEKITVAAKKRADEHLRGKTHKEIYGDKSEDIKYRCSQKLKGKTLEEILGPERAAEGRRKRREAMMRRHQNKCP